MGVLVGRFPPPPMLICTGLTTFSGWSPLLSASAASSSSSSSPRRSGTELLGNRRRRLDQTSSGDFPPDTTSHQPLSHPFMFPTQRGITKHRLAPVALNARTDLSISSLRLMLNLAMITRETRSRPWQRKMTHGLPRSAQPRTPQALCQTARFPHMRRCLHQSTLLQQVMTATSAVQFKTPFFQTGPSRPPISLPRLIRHGA
jgi:hypothetical protein